MRRWMLIVLAVALTAGGVAYMGSARYSGTPPDSINLERPKAVVQAELLTRFPPGSSAQPVRDALLKAGMTHTATTGTASLRYYQTHPVEYAATAKSEVFRKNRPGSPDPHLVLVVTDAERIVDILVTY